MLSIERYLTVLFKYTIVSCAVTLLVSLLLKANHHVFGLALLVGAVVGFYGSLSYCTYVAFKSGSILQRYILSISLATAVLLSFLGYLVQVLSLGLFVFCSLIFFVIIKFIYIAILNAFFRSN